MKNRYILISIIFLFGIQLFGQDKDVYMTFITWKYTDNSRALVATLTTDGEEEEIPAQNVRVNFYAVSDTGEIYIDHISSNDKGIAKFVLPEGLYVPKNEEGYMEFIARTEEDDIYLMAEESLQVKDVRIDFSFEMIDSVKSIRYHGIILGAEGEEMPLADDDVYFYVPRMFSDLKIADGWFEEDGQGTAEFPTDIIGDTLGNIEVIARIEEHWDYGFVEKRHTIDWAIPNHMIYAEGPSRELWTPIAPVWMIVTLIIMLIGVWGHYFYAMYQLYMIKRLSKKAKK
jgi:hypothetical protein